MEFIRKILKGSYLMKFLEIPQEAADQDLEILVFPLENKKTSLTGGSKIYDFSDITGTLQWQGDPVAEQRKLRNEWK